MNRETSSHIDDEGRRYIEEPMPEEFRRKYGAGYDGTPIRMAVYDPKEKRKFIVDSDKHILRMSDDGVEGFIAICDYFVQADNSLEIVFTYTHPFHRNKGILNKTVLFMGQLVPETATFDTFKVVSSYVEKSVQNLIDKKLSLSETLTR